MEQRKNFCSVFIRFFMVFIKYLNTIPRGLQIQFKWDAALLAISCLNANFNASVFPDISWLQIALLFLYAVACIVFPQYILSIVFRFPTDDNFVVMLFSITFPLHHRKNISYAKYDFLIDCLIISIATRLLLQTDHLITI